MNEGRDEGRKEGKKKVRNNEERNTMRKNRREFSIESWKQEKRIKKIEIERDKMKVCIVLSE